jgi:hypothetical protein
MVRRDSVRAYGRRTLRWLRFRCRRFPDSSNNQTRFNAVPQYQERCSFDWFLANRDQNIAEMKVRNPGLLYEGNWRSQVPALQPYLAKHLYEWQTLDGQKSVQGANGPGEQ